MKKTDKILVLANIVLAGFTLAVVFHYLVGICLQTAEAHKTFLLEQIFSFGDFLNLMPKVHTFAPYTPPAEWQQYFPLSYLVLLPFSYIKNPLLSYFLFAAIFILSFIFFNFKFFKCEELGKLQSFQNFFILTFLSYPFLFVLDRGNFDMFVFPFFAGFIIALWRGKHTLAAVLLGIVNSFKPFSFIFLILFLFSKKYKEFFVSILTSFLFVAGGFMIYQGNFFDQVSVMIESIGYFKSAYLLNPPGGLENSSSIFLALKAYFCVDLNLISPAELLGICNIISLVLAALAVVFTWREKVFWKKIALLTLYTFVAPPAVFDYKLIFLFPVLYLFVNEPTQSKFDFVYAVLFALLLIPKKYILVLAQTPYFMTFSVFANPVIILLLMFLIIFEQFFKRGKV